MNAARLTIWDDDACRRVHEATLEVLAETGIEVQYAPAAEIFAKAGAQVDGTRVRIPAELVEAALKSAPRDWTIKPRGGDTEPLVLDAAHTYCGTGSDVPLRLRPRHARASPRPPRRRRGHGRPLREAAQHRLRHEHGPARGRAAGDRRPASRSTRCCAARASRCWSRRATATSSASMKEMAALAGEADSFGIYAMPVPPLLFDEDGASKVIACAELDIPLIWAPAPNAGTTAPASDHVGDRRGQRRGARRTRAAARRSSRARRSSGASASAP